MFNKWKRKEKRDLSNAQSEAETLKKAILGDVAVNDDEIQITKEEALSIPAVAASMDIIKGIVGGLTIKLYKEEGGKTKEINDYRTFLLNKDTGDTLNPNDLKKAMVEDFLLHGNAYTYINRKKSLNYVSSEHVSITNSFDPIFKDFNLWVNGSKYMPYQFIRLLRNTKDGATGEGILKQNNQALKVAYLTTKYEKNLVKGGGNKKGFLKAQRKLSDDAITALKAAWNNLYKNNSENVIVLNDGLEFQEASSTSVEMQLKENKQYNNDEVYKIFCIPSGLLDGSITAEEYNSFIKTCILPIIEAFKAALNEALLTQSEKQDHYFEFDTKDILKASILERYQAYKIALESGFKTSNEVRNEENMTNIEGLDIVKMSLGSVVYDINNQTYFVPNTDSQVNLNKVQSNNEPMKGGVKDENGDKEQ